MTIREMLARLEREMRAPFLDEGRKATKEDVRTAVLDLIIEAAEIEKELS